MGLFFAIGILLPQLTIKTADAQKRSLKISKTTIPSKNKKLTAIIIDAQTGAILYEENAHSHSCPASLTKMMTIYLVFQELKREKLHFETQLKVSQHAANQFPTKLGLQSKTTISVRDAIIGTLVKSANDAACVLAEAISGTEQNFVKIMNRTAKKLGLKNTVFVNASGWPDDSRGILNPKLVSTALDMAKMARMLIKDFPEYYKFFSTQRFIFRGKTYKNHNSLLGKIKGLDGLKTGFWRGGGSAGLNLATSAKRGKTRIIVVVMGARTPQERNNKMTALIEKGFELALSQSPEKLVKNTKLTQKKQGSSNTTQKNNTIDLAGLQEILNEGSPPILSKDSMELIANNLPDPDFDQELENILRQEAKIIENPKDTTPPKTLPAPPQKPFTVSKKTQKAPFGKTKDLPPLVASEPQKEWSIQVGAFASNKIAQIEGKKISQAFPLLFKGNQPKIYPPKKGGKHQFPVRFVGLSKAAATAICKTLSSQKKPCLIIAPRL